MSPFQGPSSRAQPGLRAPLQPAGGTPMGYNTWFPFTPNDLQACYPMPPWVARRIRDYPQGSVGNALRDPLPLPFTTGETRTALLDVWKASHEKNVRRCANVDAASAQIALQVLPILNSRNGGWIDFDTRHAPYDPLFHTPGSNIGKGVNLQCILYKLAGKPLPPLYNACAWTPAHPTQTYQIRDVATTFTGEDAPAPSPPAFPGPLGPVTLDPARPYLMGADIEAIDDAFPPPLPGLPLYDLVAVFDIKE